MLLIRRLIREFLSNIGTAAHTTSDAEQVIYHTRTALVDTIASPQVLMEGLFQIQKCIKLLTKICDIQDNAVPKWVGNMLHIFTYLLNFAFRQHSEVRALHFSFLHNLMIMFLLVKIAFVIKLTGFWLRLSNNLPLACCSLQPLRGGKSRPKTSFWFSINKAHARFSGNHLQRSFTWKLHWESSWWKEVIWSCIRQFHQF